MVAEYFEAGIVCFVVGDDDVGAVAVRPQEAMVRGHYVVLPLVHYGVLVVAPLIAVAP